MYYLDKNKCILTDKFVNARMEFIFYAIIKDISDFGIEQ